MRRQPAPCSGPAAKSSPRCIPAGCPRCRVCASPLPSPTPEVPREELCAGAAVRAPTNRGRSIVDGVPWVALLVATKHLVPFCVASRLQCPVGAGALPYDDFSYSRLLLEDEKSDSPITGRSASPRRSPSTKMVFPFREEVNCGKSLASPEGAPLQAHKAL